MSQSGATLHDMLEAKVSALTQELETYRRALELEREKRQAMRGQRRVAYDLPVSDPDPEEEGQDGKGNITDFVLAYISNHSGVTPGEIREAVKTHGLKTSKNYVYSVLLRAKGKKIEKKRGKYYAKVEAPST